MKLLYTVSNTLSYTDSIPFVNIPSGILHLIIGIAEKLLGINSSLFNPRNETWKERTWRKLDDLGHLSKGALIVSIVGSGVLLAKLCIRAVQYQTATQFIERYPRLLISEYYQYANAIPEALFSSRAWVYKVCSETSLPFERAAGSLLKDDKDLVLRLAQEGKITRDSFVTLSNRLREDREVLLALTPQVLFQVLDSRHSNLCSTDRDILDKVMSYQRQDPVFIETVVDRVQNKEYLKNHIELCMKAIQKGRLQIGDFQDNELSAEIAIALVKAQPELLLSHPRISRFLDEESFKWYFKNWCSSLYSMDYDFRQKEVVQSLVKNREKLAKRVALKTAEGDNAALLTDESIQQACTTSEGLFGLFYPKG